MAAIVVVVVVVVVVIIVDVVVVVIGKQASERHFGMRGWLAFIVSCRAGATKVNSVYDLLVAPIIFPNAPPLSLALTSARQSFQLTEFDLCAPSRPARACKTSFIVAGRQSLTLATIIIERNTL